MNYFERIKIQGFRRLSNLELKLKPLNVMIGANGCGKTSFLDVLLLLSASSRGGLQEAMSEIGGISGNLTSLASQANGIAPHLLYQLHYRISDSEVPIIYALILEPMGLVFEIGMEILKRQKANDQDGWTYYQENYAIIHYLDKNSSNPFGLNKQNEKESFLSQIPFTLAQPKLFKNYLSSSAYYHTLDVAPRSPVRLPQPLRPADLPGKDGEDLISCLYSMRESNPDSFSAIEDTLRAGFPGFEKLNFPPVAAGMLAMTWKDRSSKNPYYTHQLSEGTLRFLWLATLLQSPGLPAITLIDEPEVSLHPELLSLLADLMREASQRTQLFVATHSDRLISFLKPEEVLAFDIGEDGAATAKWADEFDLEAWLKEYTLGEVWRHGRIGGRA